MCSKKIDLIMGHISFANQIFIKSVFQIGPCYLAHFEMRFLYWQNELCIIYPRFQTHFICDLNNLL